MKQAYAKKRNPWVAGALGLSMAGLGQIYNGELIKGICFFVICLLVPLTGVRLAATLPDPWLLGGVLGTLVLALCLHLLAAVEAFFRARHMEGVFHPKPYNRWYVYTAAWMVGALVVVGHATDRVKTRYVRFFKVASSCMEPQVLRGDYVIADLGAYRRMSPETGDVIVFVYPDDRSKVYLKRIAALPGQTVEQENGETLIVPHGSVFVLADKSEDSVDSRHFGPVLLTDIMGKVRQIYYSRGPDGVRWDRIGQGIPR